MCGLHSHAAGSAGRAIEGGADAAEVTGTSSLETAGSLLRAGIRDGDCPAHAHAALNLCFETSHAVQRLLWRRPTELVAELARPRPRRGRLWWFPRYQRLFVGVIFLPGLVAASEDHVGCGLYDGLNHSSDCLQKDRHAATIRRTTRSAKMTIVPRCEAGVCTGMRSWSAG